MGLINSFIGTWQLEIQNTYFPDGRVSPSRGENPAGILMYDAYGAMAVQLMRTDALADSFCDLSQIRTALEGYLAYFGTYEVDESAQIVRHYVIGATYPSYRGTIQVRKYRFDGDRLILSAASPVDESTRVLVWKRMQESLNRTTAFR